MITVAEARAIILEHARPLPSERAPLRQALGRTLREDIVSTRSQPPFSASAMDGYAVRAEDTPDVLHIIGEAGAGRALGRTLQRGECARIFTGAPLPEGADAILIQEDVAREGDNIAAPRVDPGRHVREPSVDFAAGASLLEAGRMLSGGAIALAAAAGRAELRVAKRPCVAIISGGNEIVPPGAAPAPDQVFDSVSYGVAGMAEQWGAAPLSSGRPFADDPALIAARVTMALTEADVVVLIGGASVGDHDHARPALLALGAELLFEKVALRPGKPTWFARCDSKLVLGLPGNPASAFVCARLFLRPLIERLLGRNPTAACRTRRARSRSAILANGPRESYLRAQTQSGDDAQIWVDCFGNQDSSLITVFAAANALVVRPPHAEAVAANGLVDILDL